MKKINLMDVKLNGIFVVTLQGIGSIYKLDGRYFTVGKNGFCEI